ncbi:MAG: Putative pre-16S rRNA nuclease Yqg [uncultured Rubrobacteraceae bacterium]|uniref:Pre-16S rRNA nuclease Yqg n=1 Tax=uncultured Rubrobacteraceae bacterium TaxID=349277 RepID=A0A6J4RD23_9ACTN|nr:MAG: Putative pre-16S rRNA nuclease Yqg [uncultured Rubrobacteraceae bacterium]
MIPSGELSVYLRGLVDEQGVYEVVVGVPRTLGGEVGFQARKVLTRLDALKTEFPGVRFVEWDERFTTRLAGSRRRRRVDHLAAARMLQEYLEARENL